MTRHAVAFGLALGGIFCGGLLTGANLPEREPATHVEVFEDGSGVQWIDGREVRRFEDGTFVWMCGTQGNRECGS